MNDINQKLINGLQKDFPLVSEPYQEIGSKLGINGVEVIDRIMQLKNEGIIRQISPIFDARRLGYRTTLVAMKVDENKMEKAAQVIQNHPQISHAYERGHHYNLWFTLAAHDEADIEAEMGKIAGAIPAQTAFQLPATKLYKIGTYFGSDGGSEVETPGNSGLPEVAELETEDRTVINVAQRDLPLTPAPFSSLAEAAGMSVGEFLAQCQSLLNRSIMRRYGAAVNHRRAGFTANGMACWVVKTEKIDAVGKELASLPEVSHCYERQTNSKWQQNLFAMIHEHDKEKCREIAEQVSVEFGLDKPLILFSTKEIRKTRIKYLV